MRRIKLMVLFLVASMQLFAQSLNLTLEFPKSATFGDMKFYAAPMGGGYESIKEMVASGNTFSAEIGISDLNFYNVTCVNGTTQTILPLYVFDSEKGVTVKVKTDGKVISFVDSNDNTALSLMNQELAELSVKVWKSGAEMSDDKLRKLFSDYTKIVKRCDPKGKASLAVADYMNIWAYTSTYNLVNSLPRILNKPMSEVPFRTDDVLPAPIDVLDSPLAALFPIAVDIVSQRLPKGTLSEQIDYLRANYETEDLRSKVEDGLLARYVAKYDYAVDFEGGLAQLQQLTDKYALDAKFVEQFKKNRSTVKGTAFPEDVVLKDKDGNVVDFSTFKGKFVYIDVWASWCRPCVNEIPHLQKLESELENKNVVFLSVSVDAKQDPWLKKMESLNLHGNQLWDSNSQLCKSLNINGIPFFLIYDAEGKLFMYNAPRPSQGEGLKQLLERVGK